MIDVVQDSIEQEFESQPITLEQLREILKKYLPGELTITPGQSSGSMYHLSRQSSFHVGPSESLGTRVSGALRVFAGQLIRAANAVDEAEGYDSMPELYVCRPAGFNVGFTDLVDVELQVLNAKDEQDAINQARTALETITIGHDSPAPAPRDHGPVRLKHLNRGIFEFAPDGIFGTELEGCQITVDSESTRHAAERKALEFIQWLQAQAQQQSEPVRLTA